MRESGWTQPSNRCGRISVVRVLGPQRVIYGSDHPTLPFGFEIGKVVRYAGFNSDQLDLILEKNLARPAAHRGETVSAENYRHHANLTK